MSENCAAPSVGNVAEAGEVLIGALVARSAADNRDLQDRDNAVMEAATDVLAAIRVALAEALEETAALLARAEAAGDIASIAAIRERRNRLETIARM